MKIVFRQRLKLFFAALILPCSASAEDRFVEGWLVSEIDHGCSITTSYEGGTLFSIWFEPQLTRVRLALSNESFKGIVAGKDYSIALDLIRRGRVDDAWGKNKFTGYVGGESRGVIGNYDDEMLLDLALSDGVRFERDDVIVAHLSLKGSARAIEALRICAHQVAKRSLIDPFADGASGPPPGSAGERPVKPRTSPQSWVTNDDYPAAAIRAREQGTVSFQLDVGPSGAVTKCAVTASSGSPILDQTTCGLISRRARFTPARDAKGSAIPSTFSSRFHWELPAD